MNQKTTMYRRIAILILLSLSTFFFLRSNTHADQSSAPKIRYAEPVFQRPKKCASGKEGFAYRGIRKKYQIEDYLLASMAEAPPPSPWFASEKELYRNLLSQQTFDVLVVPFQTQLDGVVQSQLRPS